MSANLPAWYDHWRIGDPGPRLGRCESLCGDCEGSGHATADDGDSNPDEDCATCSGSGIVDHSPD